MHSAPIYCICAIRVSIFFARSVLTSLCMISRRSGRLSKNSRRLESGQRIYRPASTNEAVNREGLPVSANAVPTIRPGWTIASSLPWLVIAANPALRCRSRIPALLRSAADRRRRHLPILRSMPGRRLSWPHCLNPNSYSACSSADSSTGRRSAYTRATLIEVDEHEFTPTGAAAGESGAAT